MSATAKTPQPSAGRVDVRAGKQANKGALSYAEAAWWLGISIDALGDHVLPVDSSRGDRQAQSDRGHRATGVARPQWRCVGFGGSMSAVSITAMASRSLCSCGVSSVGDSSVTDSEVAPCR